MPVTNPISAMQSRIKMVFAMRFYVVSRSAPNGSHRNFFMTKLAFSFLRRFANSRNIISLVLISASCAKELRRFAGKCEVGGEEGFVGWRGVEWGAGGGVHMGRG